MKNKARPKFLSRLWELIKRHAKPSVYTIEEKGPTSYGIEFEFDWPDHQPKTFETGATDVAAAPKPSKKNKNE
jgi:hypothetical protein